MVAELGARARAGSDLQNLALASRLTSVLSHCCEAAPIIETSLLPSRPRSIQLRVKAKEYALDSTRIIQQNKYTAIVFWLFKGNATSKV